MNNFTLTYLNYRIDKLKILITCLSNGMYVVQHPRFPQLNIEAKSPGEAKRKFEELVRSELSNSDIAKIDYFFDQLNDGNHI